MTFIEFYDFINDRDFWRGKHWPLATLEVNGREIPAYEIHSRGVSNEDELKLVKGKVYAFRDPDFQKSIVDFFSQWRECNAAGC